MSVQSWLNEIWYEGATVPWWLLPLSAMYGAAGALRRHAYAGHWLKSLRLACPLIVVGNLSVGGTGKTPLVCWLVAQLAERGLKPGVVTRGYGGSNRAPLLVKPTDDPHVVGDESILLARRTQVPVAIGRDRRAASQAANNARRHGGGNRGGIEDYPLAPHLGILLNHPCPRFGNGRLLPA